MEHKSYTNEITLLLLNELPASDAKKLEEHISGCEICKKEYSELQKFGEIISSTKEDVKADLLTKSRESLIYTVTQESKILNIPIEKKNENRIAKFFKKPLLTGSFSAAAGLLLGFFLFGNYNFSSSGGEIVEEKRISNLRFTSELTDNGNIEFSYDEVTRKKVSGSVNSPEIQKILVHSILNDNNPGTRLNSVNYIANSAGKADPELKYALISVAKYDEIPGVRLQAIKSISKLEFDDDIKTAVLFILDNDDNPGNRIEAINILSNAVSTGKKADNDIINGMKNIIETDENPFVVNSAKIILEEI
ncbi:MAG: zf-HC2 domain-containing protein [Ignavibacteriaceae bacterium]|nr:zf-HC2 domain-containing protein [Ignavibacteriaceae bacterium]